MKYFIACLFILAVPILLIAVFGLGGLYFGVANLLDGMRQLMRKHSTDYTVQDEGA
jgi:hypothetical protein